MKNRTLLGLLLFLAISPAFSQTSGGPIYYPNGGGSGGGSASTGANPTATASDTAVNGSASTFLRSDGAPAIQKGSSSAFGVVKVDNSTITASGGVISAIAGGTGTVTSVATGACLTGGTITTTGTVAGSYLLNAQTGTTYTILSGDACKLVTFSNASAIAVTLPQATGSFAAGYSFDAFNKGAGTVTITPTTSTINGAATLTLKTNEGCSIVSDGTNYQVSPGCPGAAGSTGTGAWVRATAPVLVTPALGTIASGNGAALTALNASNLSSGTVPAAQMPALTGDVTTSAGAVATTIATNAVTNAKAAQAAANTMKGNWTGSTANVADNTMPSCADSGGNHLNYVNGTGVTCGTSGGSSSGGGMFNYSDNGVTVTAGTYYTPIGGGGIPQSTEANVSIPAPSATTVANLKVSISADPGSGQTMAITLRKGGSDQTLTCTITGTGGGAATTCSDTTHSVNIAQGDVISWKLVTTGTYVATPTVNISANNGTSNVGVTSVATNNGLTGGTITTTGTIGLATIAADNLLANSSGSTAVPVATSIGSCSAGSSALTYNTSTHAFGCNTISGGATLVAPQGRLTLVTGVPIQTSDQTAKSTIYYDCFRGNGVPYYTGSADAADTIASCEVSLTMATSGTGVTNSAGVFDIWWVNGGTNRICVATNGSGGGWASDTGGSNTARGTGYSQVHNTRGYWTNVNAIATCYNGTTNYGSVSADQATYLGTIYTTAAGQTGVALKPSAASGGTNNIIGLWNAYNRVPFSALNQDNATAYTFNTNNTWQVQNIGGTGSGLNNRFSFVDGLGQSNTQAALDNFTNNGGVCYFGVNRNSTTATPNMASVSVMSGANVGASVTAHIQEDFYPAIGFNYYQFMQMFNNALGGACNVNSSAGSPQTEGLHLHAEY